MQAVRRISRRLAIISAVLVSSTAFCSVAPASEDSVFDRIWDLPALYENPDNPVVQSFSLVGRYHGQYWRVDADQGEASDWENRRKIFGFQSKMFNSLTLEAQMYLQTNGGSLYGGLYVGFVQWEPTGADISLSVGRLDYLFTGYERSKSSKRISTIERGLLVNQIMPAEVVGAHFRGENGRFSYHAGIFSRSIEEEFDDFNSGSAGVIGAAWDTGLWLDQGALHLDYLHNGGKEEDSAFRPYRHVASLWHSGETGRLGLSMDLTYAVPLETDGHVWGVTLEPSWMLANRVFGSNDPLQLVLRYQYANSSDLNGLQLQRRYEQKVTKGAGDRYQAVYAGLSYFLYGHKLKLMLGTEYANMKDRANDGGEYRGWSWFGAVRLYF